MARLIAGGPGPYIASTLGTLSVPKASAATRATPFPFKTISTPAILAAARVDGSTLP